MDATCIDLVQTAEDLFTTRWRLGSLRNVDAELHQRLREQVSLFEKALFGSSDKETRLQAEATVRGWKAACAAMEALEQPHDAFMYGTDARTGLVVAIGERPRSQSALKDSQAVFLTPGEVAALVARDPVLTAAKQAFPDAELLDAWPPKKAEAA